MNNFICPNCKGKLELKNRSLVCNNGHCFDLSKEGYVNLLPVNSKKSKLPGDNSKMVLARRAFLESGHYDPLAEKLAEIIRSLILNKKVNILDLGCGEGYYTGYLKNHNKEMHMFGLDISKAAVRYASKRYKDVIFCVASAFELPIEDNKLDIVIKNYAPSSETELQRVIKKGGHLITVTPGKRHLYQLRDIIYTEVHDHIEENIKIQTFKLENKINLKYTMTIEEPETVKNLLEMTPFGWKISEEDRGSLYKRTNWEIDCDFNIAVYNRWI